MDTTKQHLEYIMDVVNALFDNSDGEIFGEITKEQLDDVNTFVEGVIK